MKKYQLTSKVRGVGTAIIVIAILGLVSALARAGQYPDLARTNGVASVILLIVGMGLRARHKWAWWLATIFALLSISTALFLIVSSLVNRRVDGTTVAILAGVAAIWWLVLWALFRGRERVQPGTEAMEDSTRF